MEAQLRHYAGKLAYETDSWDLKAALEAGENVVVVDARSPGAYARGHIPGAINIPHRRMA
ncbi:MAG: rhodanese-like domain-containing protein, partial [Candidatus Tectomicrobia bacterium]|nr:rhodanese-like domain-containing protein [Candidatus Tectomicrobia bacterium]